MTTPAIPKCFESERVIRALADLEPEAGADIGHVQAAAEACIWRLCGYTEQYLEDPDPKTVELYRDILSRLNTAVETLNSVPYLEWAQYHSARKAMQDN